MARVVLGSYAVQFPLGGYLSWVLQWLLGIADLGHEAWFVEGSLGPSSCFDPATGQMSDDPAFGTAALGALLARYGLGDRWCYIDDSGSYHGLDRETADAVLRSSDLFIDMGTHGALDRESRLADQRILVDGEPGFTQFRLAKRLARGAVAPDYDAFFTVGLNVGRPDCTVPTCGIEWNHHLDPVATRLFPVTRPLDDAPFTTVMSWKAHPPLEYEGDVYGNKDMEFPKFAELPKSVSTPMEIAVAGRDVPRDALEQAGWRLRDAHQASYTFDRFRDYVQGSRGEFSVCKQAFVRTRSGWVGDRTGVYLASGRPVVMQDTGFSAHLPTGEGLFAVHTLEDAISAIESIEAEPERHLAAARALAEQHFEATRVVGDILSTVGISSPRPMTPLRSEDDR
jgi:hypothetical protein